ncbi:MAG TPA: extracellular solute-binding protein [Chloroflexota bacterium]|nr:extracellular solute-binding protein [Chloroflexota bacterium]
MTTAVNSTRRSFLRSTAGITAGAGALGALAACGPLPSPAAKPTAKDPVTLRLVWRATEAEHTFAQRVPVFQERFPHVKVDVEFNSEYLEKLGVLFSSNSVGDVVFLEADDEAFYGFWGAQGQLTQLDPYIKRDKYDMNVFFPRAVEALKIIDGKIWSFPYKAFMARCGVFYNANAFQQNGLKIPDDNWTYDDMRTAAQRMTKRGAGGNDFWGGGRNFGGDFSFMAVTRAFGGDLYSPDGKKTLIGTEQSRQAISWWLERFHKDQSIALNPGVSNPRKLLEEGKSGFAAGYNPGDRRIIANALNPTGVQWGLSLMPKGPSGRRGGAFFLTPTGMPKIAKHPDEAWEFQKFLAEKETGVVMGFPTPLSGQTSAHFGARKDVYEDPRVLNAPDMPPGVMATLARSMALDEPYYTAHNFLANDVEKLLNAEMAKVVKGEVQADTGFFQNLSSQIQLILDKPKPSAS